MSRTGYQHLVHDYFVDQVRAQRTARQQRLAAVRTRRQALAYQQQVRRTINRVFKPRPRKSPLKAQTVGAVQYRGYRIGKVLFERRPNCLVSANLWIPDKLEAPAPGIIHPCGHSQEGKLEPAYQASCQRLVRAGFVALIYDPFNQGERDQYWHLDERAEVTNCCHAHNMMGKQLELVGEWFGMWRAWDGIRALDYLLSRPEVDADHIGLTGNSGGGTMTTWMWAIEPRFTMAAPSCFVTTFLANLENELPADCEQYPPGVIGAGLELADFIIARAPDPTLLLGQNYDFFDRRGLREAFEEVRRFYDILGAPKENTDLFIGPQTHGFSAHNQEAMVKFFARHANIDFRPMRRTAALNTDVLMVTPQGNTVAAGATPIYELIGARALQLQSRRPRPTAADLKKKLATLLQLPTRHTIPHYRALRATSCDGVAIARYAVETEGNIRAILRKRLERAGHSHTLDVEREIHLYLPHVAAEDDLADEPMAVALHRKYPLYALDVRGLGESRPDKIRDFFHPYGMDYLFHGHGLLLGQSYLGRRVYDTLATMDLLVDAGTRRIRLYGRGQGALIALFAALLHDQVTTVTLKNAPLSYHDLTQVPLVAWTAASFIPKILHHFDLPDCYHALGRHLRLIQPWGPDMRPLAGRSLKAALERHNLANSLVKSKID